MDQFYFEEGYAEASYFVYQAEARVSLDTYIEAGYLPQDFFEDRGSYSTLYCDAEIVVGMLMEAQAYPEATFALSATAVKSVDAVATFTSTFTQTSIGLRDRDIDMFAFSDAAIAVEIDRIRDNNTEVSSVFDVATDFVVERSADADVDAIFSAIVNGLRSRDTSIETQAAFSFEISGNSTKDFISSISSEVSISIDAERIRFAESTQESEFIQSTANIRIRFIDVSAEITAELSVDARKIRDAHLTGTGVASITCTPVVFAESLISISSHFAQSFNGGKLKTSSAAFIAYSSILTSRYVGSDRPTTITGTFNSSSLLNSSSRVTNLQDLPNSNDWYYQTAVSVEPRTLWDNVDAEFFYIPLGTLHGTAAFLRGSYSWRSNQSVVYITGNLGNTSSFPSSASGYQTSTIYPYNSGFILSISFTGGQKLAVYVNGVRVAVVSNVSTAGWIMPSTVDVTFASGAPYTVGSRVFDVRTSYSWLTYGNYTNSGATTYSTPTPVNTDNTIFLYEFLGNGKETTALTFTADSAITSVSSLSARLNGPINIQAGLSTSTSLTASISHIHGSDLSAFSNAALTTEADRIRETSVNLNSEFSSQSSVSIIRAGESSLSAEINVSADSNRYRDITAEFSALASTVTVAEEISGISANLSSVFTTLNVYYNNEDGYYIEDGYLESFETKINYIAAGVANASIDTSLTADVNAGFIINLVATSTASVSAIAVKTVDAISLQTNEFTQTANIQRNRYVEAAITDAFTVFCNGVTGGEINAVMFNAASLTADAEAYKPFSSIITSTATLSADTEFSLVKVFDASLENNISLTADVVITANAIIATESIASSMIIAIKEGVVEVDCFSEFTTSIAGQRLRGGSLSITSTASQSTNSVKTASGNVSANISSTISIDATVVTDAVIHTESIASELVAIARVAGFFITSDVVSSLDADVNATRTVVSNSSIASNLNVQAVKVISGSANISSQITVTSIIGSIKPASAAFTSAMSFAVNIRELRLDEIIYKIPAENRSVIIVGETRNYDIYGETRNYKIYGETRERTIAGESRIHII